MIISVFFDIQHFVTFIYLDTSINITINGISNKYFIQESTGFEKMGIFDIFKNNTNYLNKKGVKLLNNGEYSGALKYFNKALELEPDSYRTRFNRAITFWELGKTYEAIKEYDMVLDIYPGHAGAWFNLGVIISILGRYKDALVFLDTALELDPEDAIIWYTKGLILEKIDRSNEALKCMDKALKLDPDLQFEEIEFIELY